MKKLKAFGVSLVLAILIGCSENVEIDSSMANTKLTNSGTTSNKEKQVNEVNSKASKITNIDNVQYKVDLMSALRFIEIKGERVAEEDIKDLEKESVLILEIAVNEGVKDVFESDKLGYDKEEAVKYLMGEIGNDLTLFQGEEEFQTQAIQYDGNLTGANKIRVFFFFTELDSSKETTIKYYDRLFGAGLINLKQKETTSL